MYSNGLAEELRAAQAAAAAPVRRGPPALDLFSHVEDAPKTPPVRRWEEIEKIGRKVDEGVIRSMKADDLRRDIWTPEKRLRHWQAAERLHLKAREEHPGYPQKTGLYIFSAPMGAGKSLTMICIALSAYINLGIPVFSPVSAGLLFGNHISLEQLYQFSDVLPQGAVLVCDEVAALADSRGGTAMRTRTLAATMTSFRKSGGLALTGTAAEWSIDGNLRVSAQAIIEPEQYWPHKRVIVDYDDNWDRVYRRVPMKRGEMEYPPFAYLKAKGLQIPWERRRVMEDYVQEVRKANTPKRHRGPDVDLSRWKPIEVVAPSPKFAFNASALYDSFARVPVSDAYFIDADKMRAAARQDDGESGDGYDFKARVEDFLKWSPETTLYDMSLATGWVKYDRLLEGARVFDATTFKGVKMAPFQRVIRELVQAPHSSKRQVEISAIMAFAQGNKS